MSVYSFIFSWWHWKEEKGQWSTRRTDYGKIRLGFPIINCHFVIAETLFFDFFQVSYPFSLSRIVFILKLIKFLKQKSYSWLIGEDFDAGRDWGQEEKGTTRDEMAGWHHGLDGCNSEWTPGVGNGQGGLACCDSWGRKESDTTEWLNWTELMTSTYWTFSNHQDSV